MNLNIVVPLLSEKTIVARTEQIVVVVEFAHFSVIKNCELKL
jgi:hypothetical protein